MLKRRGERTMLVLGVDIGGASTDCVLSDCKGLKVHKVISTPHNPPEQFSNK